MKTTNTVPTASDTSTDETVAFVDGYPFGIRYATEEAPYRPFLWEVVTPNVSFFNATQAKARLQLMDTLSMIENVEWVTPRPAWTLPGSAVATALAASKAGAAEQVPPSASMPAVDNDSPAQVFSTAFAPLPVGPYVPAMELPDGQASNYGRCSTFCTTGHGGEGEPEGMDVSKHGPWCESSARSYVHGFSELGSPRESSVSLVKRYVNGTYNYTDHQLHQQPDTFVRFEVYEQGVSVFQFLPIGEAYRLGAALTELARSADLLDVSLDARS